MERKRDIGCIQKPPGGKETQSPSFASAEPDSRPPFLLPCPANCSDTSWQSHPAQGQATSSSRTRGGQDPLLTWKRGQDPLLTWKGFRNVSSMASRPYSVKSWRERQRTAGLLAPQHTRRAYSCGHTGTSSKAQLLIWGKKNTICRAGTETGWLCGFGSHLEADGAVRDNRHAKPLCERSRLEFLAAKSVKNGSYQLLAVAFIPTRNFTCQRGLLEPGSL